MDLRAYFIEVKSSLLTDPVRIRSASMAAFSVPISGIASSTLCARSMF